MKKLDLKLLILSHLFLLISNFVHCDDKNIDRNFIGGAPIKIETEINYKLLSRKKRYLIFPHGSSVQLIYCLTIPVLAPVSYAFGYTTSLAYMLPTDSRDLFKEKKSLQKIHRRDRRDLYPNIETFLNTHGMEGPDCVLKALCESGQRTKRKAEFLEEMLYAIFTLPEVDEIDPDMPIHYDNALQATGNCSSLYPRCPVSLFQLVMT